MRRWQIITLLILSSWTTQATVTMTKADFANKVKSVYNMIRSEAPLREKIKFIQTIDKDYVTAVMELRAQSNLEPGILHDPVYIYAWDLYDQLIPFTHLEMDSQQISLTEKSCRETISLVENSNLPMVAESENEIETHSQNKSALAIRSTVQLIKMLCPNLDKKDRN